MADSTALYQLEVKLPSGSNGETRTQVVQLAGYSYLEFVSRFDFPNIGESNKLYIATNENKTYRWDEESTSYKVVGSDYNDIELIDCGSSTTPNTDNIGGSDTETDKLINDLLLRIEELEKRVSVLENGSHTFVTSSDEQITTSDGMIFSVLGEEE
jgi:hypothetical protein